MPVGAPFEFGDARYRCMKFSPYTYSMVCNLIPIPKPGLGTLAVDRYLRVYYDPKILDEWSIDEVTGAILHEVYHVILRHHERLDELLGDKPTVRDTLVGNIAGDICINDILRETRRVTAAGQTYSPTLPKGAIYSDCVRIADWMCAPPYFFPRSLMGQVFSFTKGMDCGFYFEEIRKLLDEAEKSDDQGNDRSKEPQSGDGEGDDQNDQSGDESQSGEGEGQGDGESDAEGDETKSRSKSGKPYNGKRKPKPGEGGESGACDGKDKPWDEPSPEDGGPEGISEHKKRIVERKVARDTEEYHSQQGRGSVPGGFLRNCKNVLRPSVNVFATLRSMVSTCTTMSPGGGDYTWRKIPRRTIGGNIRLPASFKPTPKGIVFIDTSGSMGDVDTAKGLGVVAQGLQNLPKGNVTVMTGDTQSEFAKTVFSVNEVDLVGGGGTDMARCLEDAAKHKSKPDFIILVTDGETNYPERKPEGPRKIIVVLTRREQSYYPIPDYCEKICIAKENDSDY